MAPEAETAARFEKEGGAPRLWAAALCVFSLLCGWYSLWYSGAPVSDDEQLFAAAAHNLAAFGELSAGQLRGNARLEGRYHGVEPLHPALGAPLVRLVWPTDLGAAQALYLLNPLYTALTGAAVLGLGLRLGYSARAAAGAALLFGLGTPAWPYAQTFFREPLGGLLLAGAWLALEAATGAETRARARPAAWLACLALLAGALLTKVMLAAALPGFLALAWLRRKTAPRPSVRTWRWAALAAALALLGCAAQFQSLGATDQEAFYRYSGAFAREAALVALSRPAGVVAEGVLGALVSPGQGLWVVAPLLLLGLAAPFSRRMRAGGRLLVPAGALAGLLLAQALAYGGEWWTAAWGPRHLVPALPLLSAAALPALGRLLDGGPGRARFALAGLVGLGLAAQIPGVLIAAPAHNLALQGGPGAAVWRAADAPWLGHWRLLLGGAPWNLAAWRTFPENPAEVALALGLGAGAAALGAAGLWHALRARGAPGPLLLAGSAGLAAVCVSALPVLMLRAYRADPAYHGGRDDLRQAAEWVSREAQPGDAIVIQSYLDPAWHYFTNFGRARAPWHSLPLRAQAGGSGAALEALAELSAGRERVWFLTERLPTDPLVTPEEGWLAERYPQVETRAFAGPGEVQVGLYSRGSVYAEGMGP